MNTERDNIEKLILGNLDRLNDNEPMDGHFKRFEEKLRKQNKKRRVGLRVAWKVAAAAIFAFLVVNQAIIYFTPETKPISSLGDISPEYQEIEYYYTNSINAGLNQWQQLSKAGIITEEDQEMMDKELVEFDEVLNGLQEEFKLNPNDERVINAMLEYYENKLNIINLIINKLQEVKNQKEANHEIEI